MWSLTETYISQQDGRKQLIMDLYRDKIAREIIHLYEAVQRDEYWEVLSENAEDRSKLFPQTKAS